MTGALPAAPRLRQLCLMAPQLAPAVQALRASFGLEVAHRDPLVAMWGVENAVLPVGTSFIEICAPIDPDSAAARFIARRPEGGGYIVAMECDDIERRRARMAGLGVRLVTDLKVPGFHTLQLHPRDTGACMLEFNCTEGGGTPLGPYAPAGGDWQQAVRIDKVSGLRAIEVRACAPQRLAAHWGLIARAPVVLGAHGQARLELGAEIRFRVADDDEPEGVASVELFARDPAAVLTQALAAGARPGQSPDSLRISGLDFRLVAA
jgi:hypothetical protein